MKPCMEPGIYNDCEDVTAEDLVWCELPEGHRGPHRNSWRWWGYMHDLTTEEKLEMLGLREEPTP